MRKFTFLLLIILPFMAMSQQDDSTWFKKNYIKKEIYIPMRDGVKLFTSVYLPENNKEKHPILMTRTPLFCRALRKRLSHFLEKSLQPIPERKLHHGDPGCKRKMDERRKVC
jgi:predicted acyl esterase